MNAKYKNEKLRTAERAEDKGCIAHLAVPPAQRVYHEDALNI